MSHLPADTFARADIHADAHPEESQSGQAPGDELADIYSVALIALPLALFLRWLWP